MRFPNLLCLPLGGRRGRGKARREAVAVKATDPAVPSPTGSGPGAADANNPRSFKPAAPPQGVALTKPKPIPPPTPKSIPRPTPKTTQPPTRKVQPQITKKEAPAAPVPLDLPAWEHETIGHVLNVTLDVRVGPLCWRGFTLTC